MVGKGKATKDCLELEIEFVNSCQNMTQSPTHPNCPL